MSKDQTLIIGGTGKTGRRVATVLERRGLPVRPVSRGSKPPFDWNDPSTWENAVAGIQAVYMVHPGLGFPGASEQVAEFAKIAATAGVTKVVLVSTPDDGSAFSQSMRAAEKGIVEAGLALTSLRLRWFYQNFSEDFLLPSIRAGEIRVPAGAGREAFVDAEDIAEVAVAALCEDRHNGRSYEITGPRLLSFDEVAEEITRFTGQQVRYVPLEPDTFVAEQVDQGVPLDWASMFAGIYQDIAQKKLETLSTDVSEILQKPARDFKDFVIEMNQEGVWK